MIRFIAILMLALPSLALAHEMGGEHGGLTDGLLHGHAHGTGAWAPPSRRDIWRVWPPRHGDCMQGGLLAARRIPLMGMRLLRGSIALAGASLAQAL